MRKRNRKIFFHGQLNSEKHPLETGEKQGVECVNNFKTNKKTVMNVVQKLAV